MQVFLGESDWFILGLLIFEVLFVAAAIGFAYWSIKNLPEEYKNGKDDL